MTQHLAAGLLVPYGLDEGDSLVHVEHASLGCRYRCPGCDGELFIRRGEKRVHHFAHKHACECDGETALHRAAKRLVRAAMQRNGEGVSTPSLVCTCPRCRKDFDREIPAGTFDEGVEEHRVGRFVCDVVGRKQDETVLAVEVRVSHAVDDEKADELDVKWIELLAQDVVNDPQRWRPVRRGSRVETPTCPPCKEHVERIEALAQRDKITLPEGATDRHNPGGYLAAPFGCWKCKQDTLVFWWGGVPFAQDEPPTPRPRTIVYRFSKTFGGKYWLNTCGHCGATQGDNYVFLGLDGESPFAHLGVTYDPSVPPLRKLDAGEVAGYLAGIHRWPWGGK